MTELTNIIASLEQQRHQLMLRITQLQAIARRAAFEAVVNDSWKAREAFRSAEHEADRLAELALTEAHERVQRPDWREQYRAITKTEIGA